MLEPSSDTPVLLSCLREVRHAAAALAAKWLAWRNAALQMVLFAEPLTGAAAHLRLCDGHEARRWVPDVLDCLQGSSQPCCSASLFRHAGGRAVISAALQLLYRCLHSSLCAPLLSSLLAYRCAAWHACQCCLLAHSKAASWNWDELQLNRGY